MLHAFAFPKRPSARQKADASHSVRICLRGLELDAQPSKGTDDTIRSKTCMQSYRDADSNAIDRSQGGVCMRFHARRGGRYAPGLAWPGLVGASVGVGGGRLVGRRSGGRVVGPVK